MIIIKTKTGDIFVNDREIMNVTHDRELHTVDIYDNKGTGTVWRKPPIEHVESVAYINEQNGNEWKDSGSELEYLRKENKSLEIDLRCRAELIDGIKERLRQLGHDCVQWVQYYHEYMPKDLCEQMRNRGEEEKAYVNDGKDWTFRLEWMQNHQDPKEIKSDEVARLNTTIEAQDAEIRELKDQIKRMEDNERMRKECPPKEKKSWWHRLVAWFD